MNLADMSFTAVTELFTEQKFQNETYLNEINRLTKIVEAYDRDEEIQNLRGVITHLNIQIECWERVADGLNIGLVTAQNQLAEENIGLRAVARGAIKEYNDLKTNR